MRQPELLSACGFRMDGRLPGELRNFRATNKRSLNLHACDNIFPDLYDGQSFISLGLTKIMCFVYGPRPSSSIKQMFSSTDNNNRVSATSEGGGNVVKDDSSSSYPTTTATITCTVSSLAGKGNIANLMAAEVAVSVRKTMESVVIANLYTNSRVYVYMWILEDDGGVVSASISAASLAFADAGIAMRGLISSVAVMQLSPSSPLFLDPNSSEAQSLGSKLTLAILPESKEVLFITLKGKTDFKTYTKMYELGVAGCLKCSSVLEASLRDSSRAQLRL